METGGLLLSLDLGDRRIGMAVGASASIPVVPIGYLQRKTLRIDVERVLAVARERAVTALVVGMPYSLSGAAGGQARLVEGFIRELGKNTGLPIYTVDERYTSVEAEGLLRESGVEPSRTKGQVDSVAAVLILERYLAQRATGQAGCEGNQG